MSIFFRVLSAAYIAGIFLLADSPMVSDVAPFNPYSLLHIPLYGILTVLLILSFRKKPSNPINPRDPMNPMNSRNSTNPSNSINPSNPTNPINLSREMRPAPCTVETTTSGNLFHWDSINPSNSINPTNSRNLVAAGIIALVVAIADEIHQAYLPNRNASFIDVLLDIVGIVLCMLIIKRIEHMSGFSKLKGPLRQAK
jgi:hypothetical protein